MPDGGRLQQSCFLLSYFFFFSVCVTLFTCERRCCQIVLAWGRTDYVRVQSLLHPYSSCLGSRGVTEEATKTLCYTAWRCCCVSVYCDVNPLLLAAKWRWPSVPLPVPLCWDQRSCSWAQVKARGTWTLRFVLQASWGHKHPSILHHRGKIHAWK